MMSQARVVGGPHDRLPCGLPKLAGFSFWEQTLMQDDWNPKPGTRVIIRFAPGCPEEFLSHGMAKLVNGKTGRLSSHRIIPPPRGDRNHTLVVIFDEPIEYAPGQFNHFQYFAFHELQPVEET